MPPKPIRLDRSECLSDHPESFSYQYGSLSDHSGSLSYAYGSLSYAYGSLSYAYGSLSYAYESLSYAYESLSYAYGRLSYAYRSLPYDSGSLSDHSENLSDHSEKGSAEPRAPPPSVRNGSVTVPREEPNPRLSPAPYRAAKPPPSVEHPKEKTLSNWAKKTLDKLAWIAKIASSRDNRPSAELSPACRVWLVQTLPWSLR